MYSIIDTATIYNSRNYNGVLNGANFVHNENIYNSRNYNGVLNKFAVGKWFISTIVEIITEY